MLALRFPRSERYSRSARPLPEAFKPTPVCGLCDRLSVSATAAWGYACFAATEVPSYTWRDASRCSERREPLPSDLYLDRNGGNSMQISRLTPSVLGTCAHIAALATLNSAGRSSSLRSVLRQQA